MQFSLTSSQSKKKKNLKNGEQIFLKGQQSETETDSDVSVEVYQRDESAEFIEQIDMFLSSVNAVESESDERSQEWRNIVALLEGIRGSHKKSVVMDSISKLKGLSKGNEVNKEIIGRLGCQTLLDLVSGGGKIEILREVLKLIRSVTVLESTQDYFSEKNAINVIFKLINMITDFDILVSSTAILWNLSVDDENKHLIIENGGLNIFLKFINTGEPKLLQETLGCLRNLSMIDSHKKSFGTKGFIPILINFLRSPEPRFRLNGVLTLQNLSTDPFNIKIIRDIGGVNIINEVLAEFDMELLDEISDPSLIQTEIDKSIQIEWENLFIEERIGEGIYGIVYKASYFRFTVAVKVLKKMVDENDTISAVEELQLLNLLKHRNIVLLMACGVNNSNQLIILTEYCEKGNLKQVLPRTKSLQTRVKYAQELAEGLNWLHANKVIHRDLKLVNILVNVNDTIKISDFGLSLLYNKKSVYRAFKGNVKYSPPEILAARYNDSIAFYPYSEKTDVYAYGLILWEILSLDPLFPNITEKEELAHFVTNGGRPKIKRSWPSSLIRLLTSLWEPNPRLRPLFPLILQEFEEIKQHLLCTDIHGRRIINSLWNENITDISYNLFQQVFLDITRPNQSKIKRTQLESLQVILSNKVDDTVGFDRFCNIVAWFGPIHPVPRFFKRITTLLSSPYFHGFLPSSKAIQLLQREQSHSGAPFLYRFSNSNFGTIILMYVWRKKIFKRKILRDHDGSYYDSEIRKEHSSFTSLHKVYKETEKLGTGITGNPYVFLFSKK